MPSWPPPRPLSFKPRNQPRLYALREFDLDEGNTIVALFQGSLGQRPDLDIIVKYQQRGTGIRTPKHVHWAVDLLIKAERDGDLTTAFVDYLINLYDETPPYTSGADRQRPLGGSTDEALERFRRLSSYGEYSIEFTLCIIEVTATTEKTSNPQAFMFKKVLERIRDREGIFRIVSAAGQGRSS